jgi:hypothetical protein
MVRTYCKIIGTREQDYSGNVLGQGISQEMTVFSGGAGIQYTEDVIRAARDVFQLYGAKTSYPGGVFSSVMRSVAGQAFVCYGVSQKQMLGRESQFTQLFIAPREDLLDGNVFLQEVLNRNFVDEEAIHRAARPTVDEIFTETPHARCEVNQLSEQRQKVLMHAVVLLCNGRKVLLVERDKAYQRDYFRPLLRELFELVPAGHRYQIDVTTGRCADDLDRLGSSQLIVTNQPLGGTPERPQLCLDSSEEGIRIPNTRVWPGVVLSRDGRNEYKAPPDDPALPPHTKEWAAQSNDERDDLSKHDEFSTKTLQTEYSNLMECMDQNKSFWWKLPAWNKSIKTLTQLVEMHENTYILGKSQRYNAQFCERLPQLLDVEDGVEELYFDFRQTRMPEDVRKKYLAYVRIKLQNFALSDLEFKRIEDNYMNFENVLLEMKTMNAGLAGAMQEINKKYDSIAEKQGNSAAAMQALIDRQGQTFLQQMEALQRQASESGARLESLGSAQREALERQSAEQEEKIGALRQSQDEIAREQSQRTESLRADNVELKGAILAAQQATASTAEQLTAQGARLEEIRHASEQMSQTIAATVQQLSAQGARLEEFRQASASAATQSAAEASRLDGRLNELQAAFVQANPQKQIAEVQNGLDDFKRGMASTLQEVIRRVDQPKSQPDPGIRVLAQKVEHIGDDVEQLMTRVDKTNASVVNLREHVRNLSGGAMPASGGGSLLQWISIGLSALVLIGFVIGGVLFAGWQRSNSEQMERLAALAEPAAVTATAAPEPEAAP